MLLIGPTRDTIPASNPFAMVARKPEVMTPLPFGAILPDGWIKAQIEDNLAGFTGHLDSLAPDLIIKDDIYGRDRLTRDVKRKDVGALAGGGDAVQVQYLWWNSETQSNWRDGFIRSAVLAGDPVNLRRARSYVRHILLTQDKNGYLGIYDRELRYRFDGENGELWAKTTLLRGLLAWYAYCHDDSVLSSVERAVNDVMEHYPVWTSHPFYSKTPDVGGLSHGLMFTDVLETLYRLTRRVAYLDYALFLYQDFSTQTLHEDAQYAKIKDTAYHLRGHGVHTYEHLRAVAAAAYASGNSLLEEALNDYLGKISQELTPSGAPAGDEWIGGRQGDATWTGYEYCSMEELMDSYADLLGKTGSGDFGDKAERLFFNAAQGARDPNASCIAYLKTDNSYYMTGGRNGDSSDPRQTRYTYSPVHQDAAVCCVPNAGRIAPYFVEHMWMRDDSGLVATLLGPCRVQTKVRGVSVTINEETSYPHDLSITFKVHPDRPVLFTLAIRKPDWAVGFVLYDVGSRDSVPYMEKDGYILVTRRWSRYGSIHLELNPGSIQRHLDRTGATYFTNGPLVLAHPIAYAQTISKRFRLTGFYNFLYRPDSLVRYLYRGGDVERTAGGGCKGLLYNPKTQRDETVLLEPMGGTILRQVTFPK